jgi:hypothetical protein
MTSDNDAGSQDSISEVCKSIVNLRRQGRYQQAHVYISALDARLPQIPAVAIEIASIYLTQGHYIRAWDACQLPESDIFANGDPSEQVTTQIYNVDCVALALLRAYAGISRFARISTAMRVAARVHELWLAEDRKLAAPVKHARLIHIHLVEKRVDSLQHLLPKGSESEYRKSIIPSWRALNSSESGAVGESELAVGSDAAVSPSRVRI